MAKRKAKRKPATSARRAKAGRKRPRAKGSAKRPSSSRTPKAASRARRKAKKLSTRRQTPRAPAATPGRAPRLDRVRRTLDDVTPTPPSSLNLDRRGSAVRTGRAELADSLKEHATLSPEIAGGDVDVSIENAYFSGDEAPGGDNPTPDQDIVDQIGRAVGVEYQDSEELRAAAKVADRDKKRWELDPASAEDYKDRR
jgi:hypothetical protein